MVYVRKRRTNTMYRKNRKRLYRKRRNYVKKNRAPVTVSINKSSMVVPDMYYTKLKWANQQLATITVAGNEWETSVRGNSVYDPDAALGGLSAQGMPELSALYDYYTVLGSKIKVTTTSVRSNDNVGTGIGYQLVVVPYDGNPPTGTPFIVSQYNKAKYRLVGSVGSPVTRIVQYQSSASQFGVAPRAIMDATAYSSYVGSNPGSEWYWLVRANATNPLIAGTFGVVNIEVVYYVVFKDRKETLT